MWGKRESLTASKKRFLASLEMTKRESDVSQSPNLPISQSPSH